MSQRQAVHLRTKRYFLCPACEKHEFEVEHLFDDASGATRDVGPWQCDECDATWNVHVRVEDGAIDVTPAPQRMWHDWDVLEMDVINRDDAGVAKVRLVVPGLRFARDAAFAAAFADEQERKRHYYEEHTCPENYLRSTVIVALGDHTHWGDADPHGLFRFVTSFEHPLRPQHVRSSNETNTLAEHAWKALAKMGRA